MGASTLDFLHSLWYVGIVLAFFSSLAATMGNQLVKAAHRRMQARPAAERRAMRSDARWVVGILNITFVSTSLDLLSFVFAAQAILAPMAGLTIILNIVTVPIVVKEKVQRRDWASTLLATCGVSLCAAFGPHVTLNYDADDMVRFYQRTPFAIYAGVYGFIVLCLIAGTRVKHKMVWRLCLAALTGFVGGCTGIFAKSSVELIKDGAAGGASFKHPVTYPIIGAMIALSLLQLWLLNQSMSKMDAMYFIPIYQCGLIVCNTVTGLIYFQEYQFMTQLDYGMFAAGVFILLVGIVLITARPEESVMRAEEAEKVKKALGGRGSESDSNVASDSDTSSRLGDSTSQPLGKSYGSVNAAPEPPRYTLSRMRFLMLALFSFAGLTSSMFQLSFATIQNLVMEYFNVSSAEVNSLSVVFMVLYIPCTGVSTYTIQKYGLRSTLIGGALVTAVGAWLRYGGAYIGGSDYFWMLFTGQCLAAGAQPLILNGVTTMATKWFGERERSTAVTVGTLTTVAGMGLSFILGPLIVHNDAAGQLVQEFTRYMLVTAVASSVAAVFVLAYREAPATPPSPAAEAADYGLRNTLQETPGFWHDFRALMTNSEFMKLMLAFASSYSALSPLNTTIAQVFRPEGFEQTQIGLLGVVQTFVGWPGSFLVAYLMMRTGRLKLLLVVGCLGLAASVVLLPICMSLDVLNYAAALTSMSMLSFFAMALMPLSMELGVEVTYPVPASISTSVLYLAAMLMSVVITYVCDALQSKVAPYRMTNALWFASALTGVSVLFALSMKGRYLRQEFERAARETGEKASLKTQISKA